MYLGKSLHLCTFLAPLVLAAHVQAADKPSRGTLVSATPIAQLSEEQLDETYAAKNLEADNGVVIYRVVYETQTPAEEPIQASGLILVPTTGATHFPWISLQHGTLTGKGEAPSLKSAEGIYEASQGFVTVVPDYIGYGNSAQVLHPYLLPKGYVDATIDLLRAARSFAASQKISLDAFFLKGYSEGGYATFVLQKELETKYASEFPLTASSPSAGPYNLEALAQGSFSAPSQSAFATAFIIFSMQKWANNALDLSQIFSADLKELESLLTIDLLTPELLEPKPSDQVLKPAFIADFLTPVPTTEQALLLRGLFAQANLMRDTWVPQTPTRFYHCPEDEIVNVAFTQQMVEHLRQLDANAPVSSQYEVSADSAKPYTHVTCPLYYSAASWFKEILAK